MTTFQTREEYHRTGTPEITGAFTVGYRDLVDAVKALALATGGPKSMPILRAALVTVSDEEAIMGTFDYEVSVTVRLSAEDTVPGVMLVDVPSLTKVLSAAGKGTTKAIMDRSRVTVTVADGIPTVSFSGYAVPLCDSVAAVDQYPSTPATSPATHTVDRAAFTALVSRVIVAASTDTNYPILTGIHAAIARDEITLTATDRFRLAAGTVRAINGDTVTSAVIPAAVLAKVLAHMHAPHIDLGISYAAGTVWATISDGTTVVRVHTIDGEYPRVCVPGGILSRIMEQIPEREVTVSRAALLKAATVAAALSAATTSAREPLTITVDADTLTVAPATKGDSDKVKAPALPATVEGNTARWVAGANPAYFLAAIGTLVGDKVTLSLMGPERPMVLTDAGGFHTFKHVIMPARF